MLPTAPTSPSTATPNARRHRQTKDDLSATPHPKWLADMLVQQQSIWNRVTHCEVFQHTVLGEFPEAAWRRIILEFWCVIEAFPKYMGLTLAKTTYGKQPRDYLAREWLIGNIRVESLHAGWYIDWARAHGISESELLAHRPGPEIAALYEWLFSIAHRGSLAQAIGAINYAIEGTTGAWSPRVYGAFDSYYGDRLDAQASLQWLRAHAKYDDLHPIEALEIVKLAAHPHEHAEIASGVLRSLELFAGALEACGT